MLGRSSLMESLVWLISFLCEKKEKMKEKMEDKIEGSRENEERSRSKEVKKFVHPKNV